MSFRISHGRRDDRYRKECDRIFGEKSTSTTSGWEDNGRPMSAEDLKASITANSTTSHIRCVLPMRDAEDFEIFSREELEQMK